MREELEIYTVQVSNTVIKTCAQIKKNKRRAVVVLDEQKVIGVISEGDIMEALIQGRDVHDTLKGLANHSFKFRQSNQIDNEVFELFKSKLITLLPVVDENLNLIDVITISDVFEKVELV